MNKQRIKRALTIVICGVAIGSGIAWFQMRGDAQRAARIAPAAGDTEKVDAVTVGGPFTLVNQNGVTVTEKDYPGLKLAFFGFTHCPDVCPTGLQKIKAALQVLGDDAQKITPLFITVDPERDTPDALKDFLTVYDERFVGLTGTPDQIRDVTKSFRVYAAKAEGADPEHYMINHSGFMYLLDDKGEMLTVFGADEDPAQIAGEIRKYISGS